MLTNRYMVSNKNIHAILQKIVDGAPPEKFNLEHLQSVGFGSSNDRAIIPLLKELGFLTPDGSPTERYREYRDGSQSRKVLGRALRETYGDLFHINEKLSKNDKESIVGKFKSTHGATDDLAGRMATTFLTLLEIADTTPQSAPAQKVASEAVESKSAAISQPPRSNSGDLQLAYNIQIQLPATKDIEIYHAIFKSIKEKLMN